MAPRPGDAERLRGASRSADHALRERFVPGGRSLVLRVSHDLTTAPLAHTAVAVVASPDDLLHFEVRPGFGCADPVSQADLAPRDLDDRLVLDVLLRLSGDEADRPDDQPLPVVRVAVPASIVSVCVEATRGTLSAAAVDCDQLTLYATSADVSVSRCGGFVAATVGRGSVTLSEVDGEASCSVGRGGISVQSCRGRFRLHVGDGDVCCREFIGSSLTVDSGDGDVTLGDALAESLQASAKRGRVELRRFSTASLSVAVGTGSCLCSGDLAEGSHTLAVERGDLEVETAGDTPLRFDLSTGAGEIVCPLPSVQVGRRGRPSSRGQRLVGVYRSGTVHLNASVGRGDLTLRLGEAPQ